MSRPEWFAAVPVGLVPLLRRGRPSGHAAVGRPGSTAPGTRRAAPVRPRPCRRSCGGRPARTTARRAGPDSARSRRPDSRPRRAPPGRCPDGSPGGGWPVRGFAVLGASTVGLGAGYAAGGPVAAVVVAVYAAVGALAWRQHAVRARSERAFVALLDAVDAVTGDLRAGLAPFQGAPYRLAITGGAAQGTTYGASTYAARRPYDQDVLAGQDRAVDAAIARLDAAYRISEALGAPLADLLDRVDADLRADRRLRSGVRAQTAGAQATSVLLAALPFVGLALGAGIGAHPLRELLHTRLGAACALTAVGAAVRRARLDRPAGPRSHPVTRRRAWLSGPSRRGPRWRTSSAARPGWRAAPSPRPAASRSCAGRSRRPVRRARERALIDLPIAADLVAAALRGRRSTRPRRGPWSARRWAAPSASGWP